ncbi:MAG: adenosylhomocysteinase [Actinomycetota bacterium]|nr:adenosylhomocysteinase [Actinomycetota bacterium]
MPVLRGVGERFAAERPFAGLVVGACLHVTAETANLVQVLIAGGARVALCAANPLSTQPDVAEALQADGVEVHAEARSYESNIDAVLAAGPRVTMDDGADLALRVEGDVLGGTEETATGVIRLRAAGLPFPVIAVNEGRTARLFDTRYGTGQSTLDGILRATNVLLAGRTVVVLGFGGCGRGIALRAAGLGAQVIVCEVDPLAALEAAMEGYRVMPALDAAREGDVFVTATGTRDVLTRPHFEAMKDGAILANAGHFDVEIDKAALAELTESTREVRPLVAEHALGDGRRLHLLAEGRVVNLAAGEGHPPSVMDVGFATQALAVERLVRGDLPPGVHPVPEEIDREVARLALESLGAEVDRLTDAQAAYLHTWAPSA